MRVTRIFAAVALGLAGNLALAADPDQAIRSSLKAIDPEMKIEAIAESPLTGIFGVHLPGGRVLYSSAGGQYGQQPALSSLVRQLRDVQRIRRARKGWQLRALARFA